MHSNTITTTTKKKPKKNKPQLQIKCNQTTYKLIHIQQRSKKVTNNKTNKIKTK